MKKLYLICILFCQLEIIAQPPTPQQLPGSGNAISFDGIDDKITADRPLIPGDYQDFTVEFWVFNRINTGFTEFISQGFQGDAFYIGTDNSGTGNLRAGDNWPNTGAVLPLNKWTHVCITNKYTTGVLYLDGVQIATNPNYYIGFAGASTKLAAQFNGTIEFANAMMDEVRIWKVALTQTQVRERMCRKITNADPLFSNLIAYYNFDETSGTTAFDGITTANNGTFVNGPARVSSGAAIGNVSAYSYAGSSSNISLTNPNRADNLTATSTSPTTIGLQVFCVTEAPNNTNGQNAVPGNNGYFGVFTPGSTATQFTAVYNYTGITGIANENNLKLYNRATNAVPGWSINNASLNTTLKTLTLTEQITAEFMVGLDQAPKVSLSGALTGDYPKLKEAFDAINAGGGSGAVTVTVLDNTYENNQAILNQTNYTVNVIPAGNREITGSLNTALIVLNGADNVTFDGKTLSGANTLTIRNNLTSETSGTIQLFNDADNVAIRRCILEASPLGSSVNTGIITVNTSTAAACNNPVIDSNIVRPVIGTGASRGIMISGITASAGLINNPAITNNFIENVFLNNASSAGIYTMLNCVNSVIKGNSIYNSRPYLNATDGKEFTSIIVESANSAGSGALIDSNFVGGTTAYCGGAKMQVISPGNRFSLSGVAVADISGNPVNITRNTIKNIELDIANPTSATGNPMIAIFVQSGNLQRLESNTIGSTTNNSINVTMRPGNFGQTGCFGILTSTGCANPVAANFIGGINMTVLPMNSSSAITFFNIMDSRSAAVNLNIKKNIIGSTTTDNISVTNNSTGLFTLNGISITQTAANSIINADSNTFRNMSLTNSNVNLIRNLYSGSGITSSAFTMNANNLSAITTTGSGVLVNGLSYTNNTGVVNNIQTVSINNNVMDGIAITSGMNSTLRGYSLNNGATITARMKGRITGNMISNLTNNAIAGSQTLGLNVVNDILANDSLVIANNVVNNIVDASTGVIATVRGNISGISLDAPNSNSSNATPGLAVIRDNLVSNVQSKTTDAATVRTQGIALFGNMGIIERNKVYNLSNTSTSNAASITALFLSTRADDANNTLLLRNNMLAVNNTTTAIQTGIMMGTGTVKANIYHNSVLVEGSSVTNSYALLKSSTAAADVKNNILYNATNGAGTAFSIGLGTNNTGYTGNNNYFVSPQTSSLAQVGTTSYTLAGWQAATLQDAATKQRQSGVNTNPANLFANRPVGNLLINVLDNIETQPVSDQGLALSAFVPTDFLRANRNTSTPDIGAHEFVFSTLPVRLLSFAGKKMNTDAQLQWRTAQEVDLQGFQLQRSTDGQSFATIATIAAGISDYSYNDAGIFNSNTILYYRLKMVNNNGQFTLSNIIKLVNKSQNLLTVYPNPVSDVLTVSGLKEAGVLSLYAANGKLVHQQNTTTQALTIDMSKYIKGTYLLQYISNGEMIAQKIVKQ